jgi:hypothetical protein
MADTGRPSPTCSWNSFHAARRLRGHQGVKDDPAGLAPDEGDVGEVKPADLIDARDHLVESVVVVENGLAEQ